MTTGRRENILFEGGSTGVLAGVDTTITVVPRLTIQKLAQKLLEIESDKSLGHEIALLGVESIDYLMLCALCKVGDPVNDPNLMPSRFLLLQGATDKTLEAKKNLNPFPYALHDQAPETISVHSLRRHLVLMGYLDSVLADKDKDVDFELDVEFRDAMGAYLNDSALAVDGALDGGTYTTKPGDNLSDIADAHGIREWRVLWQLNKDKLGEDWDVIPEKTGLRLPDTSKNPLVDWFRENGWDDYLNPDLGYEYPGKYLSLTFTDEQDKPLEFKDEKGNAVQPRCEIYVTDPVPHLLHTITLKAGDDLDVVVPDTEQLGLWVDGQSISWNGVQWPAFQEFLDSGEGADYGRGACRDEIDLPWAEDSGGQDIAADTFDDAEDRDDSDSEGSDALPVTPALPTAPRLPSSPF